MQTRAVVRIRACESQRTWNKARESVFMIGLPRKQ